MYRFSRTLYLELKDLVDPHPDTISVAEARRRVLEAAQSTVERLASDPRYFPQPARSLFQQIRCYFPISQQAHVFYAIERMVSLARASIQIELDRLNEANARCRATTRKGKACQRTPLPGPRVLPVALASRGALDDARAGRRSRLSETARAMMGACTTFRNA